MSFLGEQWGWKHTAVTIFLVFVGASLYQRNFLGVPSAVNSLVGSVTAPLGNFNIGTTA